MTKKEIRKIFTKLCKEQKQCILDFKRAVAYYNELDKEQDLYGHYNAEEYKCVLDQINDIIESSKNWFGLRREETVIYLQEMSDM